MKRGIIAWGLAILLLASLSSAAVHTQQPVPEDDEITVVIDPNKPNVLRGEWIYWPVTIANSAEEPRTVTLGVTGVQDWATYRIDPQRTRTIDAGEQAQAYIYLAVDDDAPLGLTSFEVTADTAQGHTRTTARLAVISKAQQTRGWVAWAAVAIVLIALAILAYALAREDDGGGDDDEVLSFY